MLELLLCSLFTIFPDYLYRRYGQGKRFGREITLYSVWYELRYGITACVMLTIALIGWFRPDFLPAGPHTKWRERFAGLKNIWAPVLLFIFVIGGLYGLPFLPRFTPTEAGGVGATGAFLIGVLTGRLNKEKILASLLQATRTAAAVFTVLIGALIFGYFLTVTQTPQKVTELLTGLGLGR